MSTPGIGGPQRSRLILLLLAAIFAAPVALSWYLFNFTQVGRDGGSASHGQLVTPPRPLPEAPLYDLAGRQEVGVLRSRWSLLYLIAGSCERPCQDALDRLRQLRLALGRNDDRVQRVLVVYGRFPPDLPAAAPQAYPGQLVMAGSAVDGDDPGRSFRLFDGDIPLRAGRVYLVDPMGNLMLAWPAGINPAGIIADLNRLLRYSGAG
jgi:cytochrome oxidase Cu insertion factor (SCO1/SenC/PrrC family)